MTARPFTRRAAAERIARLREQYELLEKRIGRIEQGSEPLDGSSLQALRMRRDGLLQNLQALKAPERKEGCCGCGRACGVDPLSCGLRFSDGVR